MGSSTVFINNKQAHRLNDMDQHCGGVGRMIEASTNVDHGRLSRSSCLNAHVRGTRSRGGLVPRSRAR